MTARAAATAAGVDDAARQSALIFLGTVEQLQAATMPAVPVSSDTVIVKVDEVYRAPDMLGDLSGSEVTVQLREDEPLQAGQQAVFFTKPWLYGEGVAVVEVERREVRGGRGAAAASARTRMGEQVAAAVANQSDEALRQRVAAADAIVVGRVVNAEPVAGEQGQAAAAGADVAPGGTRVSEHDPQWWQASIAVESVAKGTLPRPPAAAGAGVQPTVTVTFANSMDVMWFDSPKLRVGEEGVWFLHGGAAAAEAGAAPFATLDPLDAHTKTELEHIQQLIDEVQGESG
jgi:hypothetical protein